MPRLFIKIHTGYSAPEWESITPSYSFYLQPINYDRPARALAYAASCRMGGDAQYYFEHRPEQVKTVSYLNSPDEINLTQGDVMMASHRIRIADNKAKR